MSRATVAFILLVCTASLRAHPEIENALNRLNALIASSPANADLFVQRGELYARHAEWVVAEANYLRAAELDSQHARLAQLRGALELSTGRAAEARAHLDIALHRNPGHAEALVLRARAHVALNQPAAAIADFNRALELIATPPPELFLERAKLLPAARAIASLDEAIARIGPAIPILLTTVHLEESIGRIDAAVARLDRVAAESERKEAWLKRRGDLLQRAGRLPEARAAYASALAAITALPDWLRNSAATRQLSAELSRLTLPRS